MIASVLIAASPRPRRSATSLAPLPCPLCGRAQTIRTVSMRMAFAYSDMQPQESAGLERNLPSG
jgi:hypothetical protein